MIPLPETWNGSNLPVVDTVQHEFSTYEKHSVPEDLDSEDKAKNDLTSQEAFLTPKDL